MTERRDVAPAQWRAAAQAGLAEGFLAFDWLGAAEDPHGGGLLVRCHLIDPTPRALRRLELATTVPDGLALPSLSGLYAAAAWCEREAVEMLGLEVSGFEDGTGLGLRALLLHPDAGLPVHPLRKSVLLAARESTPWPGAR